MRTSLWLAVVCAIAGCAKSLDDLRTFACAADHRCPNGYSCLDDDLCHRAVLDGPCRFSGSRAASTDPCSVAVGLDASCIVMDGATQTGICETRCSGASPACADGHACSTLSGTNGVCLVDAQRSPCPFGTDSTMMDGQMLCVPSVWPQPGSPCTVDAQCEHIDPSVKYVCAQGTCAIQCGGGLLCTGATVCKGTPAPGCLDVCASEADCQPDLTGKHCDLTLQACVATAAYADGQACQQSAQCMPGASCAAYDEAGVKWQVCTRDCPSDGCPEGFACSANRCVPEIDDGSSGCAATPPLGLPIVLALLALRRRRWSASR